MQGEEVHLEQVVRPEESGVARVLVAAQLVLFGDIVEEQLSQGEKEQYHPQLVVGEGKELAQLLHWVGNQVGEEGEDLEQLVHWVGHQVG